jgi:hypothetical protein
MPDEILTAATKTQDIPMAEIHPPPPDQRCRAALTQGPISLPHDAC